MIKKIKSYYKRHQREILFHTSLAAVPLYLFIFHLITQIISGLGERHILVSIMMAGVFMSIYFITLYVLSIFIVEKYLKKVKSQRTEFEHMPKENYRFLFKVFSKKGLFGESVLLSTPIISDTSLIDVYSFENDIKEMLDPENSDGIPLGCVIESCVEQRKLEKLINYLKIRNLSYMDVALAHYVIYHHLMGVKLSSKEKKRIRKELRENRRNTNIDSMDLINQKYFPLVYHKVKPWYDLLSIGFIRMRNKEILKGVKQRDAERTETERKIGRTHC